MPIDLTLRSENGAALSATQNDTNLTDIETAVNELQTTVTTLGTDKLDVSDFHDFFEGEVSGKETIDWVNVINKPTEVGTPCLFRAVKTDADQTISASGTAVVNFSTESYDIGSNFSSSTFTAPVHGIYDLGTSVQVELVSGSPTNVSILTSLIVGAAPQDQVTLDNTGTGTRIYKVSAQLELDASDNVTVEVDFTWTGTATWKVAANNTALWGKLVHAL